MVPSGDRRHVAGTVPFDRRFEVSEEIDSRLRSGVPAVSERVGHRVDLALGGEGDQRVEVGLIGVDAAVADEPREVDATVVFVRVLERRGDRVVRGEFAIGDSVRNSSVLLGNDAPGTDGEVADLAVSHLPDRKSVV